MDDRRFPENRKHNLGVEFSRYASYNVGDVLQTTDDRSVTVVDFAYRFTSEEFVYWLESDDGTDLGPFSDSTLEEYTVIESAEPAEYIKPGFEDADRSDDPATDELG